MPATLKSEGLRSRATNIYYTLFLSSFGLILIALFGQALLQAGNDIRLYWTAPGDDYNWGKAAHYEIRYSSIPIGKDTTGWWNLATHLEDAPPPSPAGYSDFCLVRNLSIEKQYFFAIKTADEAFNWSEISNIAEVPVLSCIDMNHDSSIDILDAVYMLNYLYKDGPPIPPDVKSDIDGSGSLDIMDAIYLIDYKYKNGPLPYCP